MTRKGLRFVHLKVITMYDSHLLASLLHSKHLTFKTGDRESRIKKCGSIFSHTQVRLSAFLLLFGQQNKRRFKTNSIQKSSSLKLFQFSSVSRDIRDTGAA